MKPKIILTAILLGILILPAVACGGGSQEDPYGSLKGKLTDSFGGIVNSPDAAIMLVGTDLVVHPDANGYFMITARAGNYEMKASFVRVDAGVKLTGIRQVGIVGNKTLDLGTFEISDNSLEEGWARYRLGNFDEAESYFGEYLAGVRTVQVNAGSSSAYNGLGWTHAEGMNQPLRAIEDFNNAISGWNGNTDAWVGLAGCQVIRMKKDGGFHFSEALDAINKAIDQPGAYSSAPTHDEINEIDLKAYRALVNLLAGNLPDARVEAVNLALDIGKYGNYGSQGAIDIVLVFTD
ncbi:MAG: hypothetical protein ABIC40_02830 [bacterium]